jgi:hypothetical protein
VGSGVQSLAPSLLLHPRCWQDDGKYYLTRLRPTAKLSTVPHRVVNATTGNPFGTRLNIRPSAKHTPRQGKELALAAPSPRKAHLIRRATPTSCTRPDTSRSRLAHAIRRCGPRTRSPRPGSVLGHQNAHASWGLMLDARGIAPSRTLHGGPNAITLWLRCGEPKRDAVQDPVRSSDDAANRMHV